MRSINSLLQNNVLTLLQWHHSMIAFDRPNFHKKLAIFGSPKQRHGSASEPVDHRVQETLPATMPGAISVGFASFPRTQGVAAFSIFRLICDHQQLSIDLVNRCKLFLMSSFNNA